MRSSQESTASLIKIIKESSLSRLKLHSKRENISVIEESDEHLVFGHWMSLILLSGKDIRILFKTHYMSEAAKFFAEKSYRTDRGQISKSRALDFFKEFCNLTAGNIKILLESNRIKVGISLPIIARGFDEIFYPRPAESTLICWSLNCGEEKIFCSAHIAISEHLLIRSVNEDGDSTAGDVEFL